MPIAECRSQMGGETGEGHGGSLRDPSDIGIRQSAFGNRILPRHFSTISFKIALVFGSPSFAKRLMAALRI